MAKVTITYEHNDLSAPTTYAFEVDAQFEADIKAALLAHPVHGYVVETKTVQVEEGQDENGDPIMVDREVTTRNPASFEEALKSWTAENVNQRITSAVNAFRKAKAEAAALAAVNVPEVVATEV